MAASLLVSAFASLLASAFLVLVGWAVAVRPASSHRARTASSAFAAWWYALAASTGSTGLAELLAAFEQLPLTLALGLGFAEVTSLCVGLAGLLYYLIYLYTGRTGSFWPLAIFYALAAGVLVRATAAWGPRELATSTFGTEIVYLRPASEAEVLLLLGVLIGPQLLASLGLFALASRLPRSAGRVRLRAVAGAIFVWFASTLVATAVGAAGASAWQVVQPWIPVVVGAGVLLVHRPPAWLARRLPPELPAAPPFRRIRTRRT